MDRPLFTAAHFSRFEGEMAKIKLQKSEQDRRSYTGFIRGVADACVLLEVDGRLFKLAIEKIESARLVPQF